MYQIIDMKTGKTIPVKDQTKPLLFNTKLEAKEKLKADLKVINSGTRSFAKSYDLPVATSDILYLKDYTIVEV
jgi:hypothetical protein